MTVSIFMVWAVAVILQPYNVLINQVVTSSVKVQAPVVDYNIINIYIGPYTLYFPRISEDLKP